MIYCIEGGDRRGKTTQAAKLAEYLKCPVIKFPNEKYYSGQVLRKILNKEKGYSYQAESFQALQVVNRLESNQDIEDVDTLYGNVVLDRHNMSGTVYSFADNLPEEWVRRIMSFVSAADFTIVLYGEPYGQDYGVFSDADYQKKIDCLFLQELNRYDYGYAGINVTCKTEDQVHKNIIASLPEEWY